MTAVSHTSRSAFQASVLQYLQEADMGKKIRKLFGAYLIRVASQSVSSPSRAGFFQPDVRKLKQGR